MQDSYAHFCSEMRRKDAAIHIGAIKNMDSPSAHESRPEAVSAWSIVSNASDREFKPAGNAMDVEVPDIIFFEARLAWSITYVDWKPQILGRNGLGFLADCTINFSAQGRGRIWYI